MGLGSMTGPGSRSQLMLEVPTWRLRRYRPPRGSTRAFTPEEELALVGFLAGYSGLTRDAYALDLRQYVAWCTERDIVLFGARGADIESFGRHLESLGRARATISRRLCTIAAFCRSADEERLIATSPAVHVRRPRFDYESNATGLDRNEVGAMLVAAGLASARDHALISLLALNGLRVSESHRCRYRTAGSRARASHPDHLA
jgi:integrase/recombinase XerD